MGALWAAGEHPLYTEACNSGPYAADWQDNSVAPPAEVRTVDIEYEESNDKYTQTSG